MIASATDCGGINWKTQAMRDGGGRTVVPALVPASPTAAYLFCDPGSPTVGSAWGFSCGNSEVPVLTDHDVRLRTPDDGSGRRRPCAAPFVGNCGSSLSVIVVRAGRMPLKMRTKNRDDQMPQHPVVSPWYRPVAVVLLDREAGSSPWRCHRASAVTSREPGPGRSQAVSPHRSLGELLTRFDVRLVAACRGMSFG